MADTLYGGHSENCCGYCSLHRCFITVRQLKQKECLKKQCSHLQKNEEHEYWRQRERAKAKRIARKERMASIFQAA